MIKFHCLFKRTQLLFSLIITCTAIFLTSCGGGAGAAASLAGVGSGGTGVVVQGLVTGFGSVFIDGTEYLLNNSTQVKEQFDGNSQTGLFSLGQIVTATVDSSNTVIKAEISPDLQGVITYKPQSFTTTGTTGCNSTTDYYLYVLNQKVRIVTQACNTALNVTTVFNEPYALCSANNSCSTATVNSLPAFIGNLVSGSEVKVHGFWTINPSSNTPELVATRIDQYYLPSNSSIYNSNALGLSQNIQATTYELSGIVSAISSATISINGVNGANGTNGNNGGSVVTSISVPTNLAVNQVVSMNVTQTTWNSYFGTTYDTAVTPSTVLAVSGLTINTATSFTSTTNPTLQVSGFISSVNGNIATVNGTPVILPNNCSNCAVGDYIRVKGSNTTAQGDLEGASVEYSANTQVTLKGVLVFPTILNNTATVVFQGTSVLVSNLSSSGCQAGATQYVVVNASYSGSTLTANSISCTTASSSNLQSSAIDYVGTTSNYTSTSSQFTLTVNGIAYTVNYNANTYIEGDLTSNAPNSQYIEVVGQVTGTNIITATALKVAENTTLKSNSD